MVNIHFILKLTKNLLYPHGLQTADDALTWQSLKPLFEFLLEEYQDRAYHNLYHILSGLKFFESEIVAGREVNDHVIIAWIAHDALMNEKECSMLIRSLLKNSLPTTSNIDVGIVALLVEYTGYYLNNYKIALSIQAIENSCSLGTVESHVSNIKNFSTYFNLLALADLKVLWGNSEDYVVYAESVKKESMQRYSLTQEEYVQKRSEFLNTYITEGFFPIHPTINIKENMLYNMQQELIRLQNS